MDSIRQGKIRKIYYVSNLAIILFMVFTLNVPVLINLNREYERKEKQLSTSIINQKKLYLETIILEKIADIDLIREETASEINKYAVFISDSIAALLRNKYRNGNDLINSVDSGGTLPLLPVENLQYSIIDIADYHTELLIRPQTSGHLFSESIEHSTAIPQSGQRIVIGNFPYFTISLFHFFLFRS